MNFIFREKLIRPGLVLQNVYPKVVLIADPQDTQCRIYARHFDANEVICQMCSEYHQLHKTIHELDPHLLLLTLTPFEKKIAEVKKITKKYPRLRIVTLSEGNEFSGLKELMSLGVSGHINKGLTRARDVVELAQSVLNY